MLYPAHSTKLPGSDAGTRYDRTGSRRKRDRTPEASILLVDDDLRICRLIRRYLILGGYDVTICHSGRQLHNFLIQGGFDLVLLDVMLPEKDGFTLAQEIRQHSNIPLIFLSAKSDINDKVSGLKLGADDYITKPFEETELIARIQSVLRRTGAKQPGKATKSQTIASFAGWTLNLITQGLVSPEGREIEITHSEFLLLAAMVKRPNKAISRDDMLNMISGRDWSPLDRSVDMAIAKLRKKLEKNPRKPELIKTIRNRGYMLAAQVSVSDSKIQ